MCVASEAKEVIVYLLTRSVCLCVFVQPLHSQEDTDDDGFSKLSSHLCRHNGAVMAASGLCWGIIRPCKHRHASWPESSLKLLLAIERIHTGIAFRIQMCVLSKSVCVCVCACVACPAPQSSVGMWSPLDDVIQQWLTPPQGCGNQSDPTDGPRGGDVFYSIYAHLFSFISSFHLF